MLSGKYIVAQYTGYPSFINEAGCGVFADKHDLASKLDQALNMTKETRDAAGQAGRKWLLKNQNHKSLALGYIKKIQECCIEKA